MPFASGKGIEKGVIFKRSYIPEPSDLGKCDIFLHVHDHCGFQFVCINQMSFTLIPLVIFRKMVLYIISNVL